MRISDEIDALEVMGIQPITFLCATRLLGAWIALPFLYLVGIGVMYLASYLAVVNQVGDVSSGGYSLIFWMFQSPPDLIFSLIKGMVMATVIVLVGCYYGYTASGGPVGRRHRDRAVDGRQHHPRPHHRHARHGGLLGRQPASADRRLRLSRRCRPHAPAGGRAAAGCAVAAEHLFDPEVAGAVARARLAEALSKRRCEASASLGRQRALVRADHRVEERGGGEVGDAEALADQELAVASRPARPRAGPGRRRSCSRAVAAAASSRTPKRRPV